MDLTKEILEEKGYDIDEEGFSMYAGAEGQGTNARKVPTIWGRRNCIS